MRERSNNFSFDRNRMFTQLLVERLAKRDDVLFASSRFTRANRSPELQPVEVVEAATIPDSLRRLGPEVDSARKNPLETLNQAPVVNSVRWQTKFIEDLRRRAELYLATSQPNCLRGDPDGHEAILAVRQAEAGVTTDLQKKLPFRRS